MGLPSFTKVSHHEPYPAIDPMRPELSAEGRVVLITGAGSGVGRATVLAFGKAKAEVIILTGRRPGNLDETKQQAEAAGVKSTIETHKLDVSSEDSVRAVFHSVTQKHGIIDIVVNCAGLLADAGHIHETSLSNFWNSFEINVKGAFLITQHFLKRLVDDRPAVLIQVNSLIAHFSAVGQKNTPASYAVSKLAQAKLVEYIATETDEQPHIRAYSVQPGIIESDMSNKSLTMAPPGTKEALTWDSVDLPACFFVWLASKKGECIPSGRYLWTNWDVDELEARSSELVDDPDLLTQTMKGWPFPHQMT